MKKLFLLFLLLTSISTGVQAQTFSEICSTGQELRYMVLSDRKTVEVAGVDYMGASSNAIIPDKVYYKGRKYTVTAIGRRAFAECDALSSITLPISITTIDNLAFTNCHNLYSISIPHSVTTINYGAFSECENLTVVTLPHSITTIGEQVFSGCRNLTSIILPNSLTTISKHMFYQCSSLTTITIPSSVTSIEEWAFAKCESLTSITLPHSVTTIGEWAFSGCLNLTDITLPNTLTTIGKRAFHDCLNITSLTIPSSVISIGDEAFAGCTHLSSILIPNSVTEIGNEIFVNCHSLENVVIASDNPAYGFAPADACTSTEWEEREILLIDKRTGRKFDAKGGPILRTPEVRATFPGGMAALKRFLVENVEYPPGAHEATGVVILEFVVENDGTISTINVLRSVCEALDKESIRVVRAMPKWIPAQDEGQPCRSYYQLPFTYMIQ